MIKRIIKEDEKRDQEETQDCQRSDPFHSQATPNNLLTLQKFKVLDFRDISTYSNHTSSSHSLSSIFLFLLLFAKKANIVCLLFIFSQTCFNKNDFLLFVNNRFSLFFELLDNLATSYYLTNRRRSGWIVSTLFVDLSNIAWVRKDLTKQTVGS